MGLGGIVGIGGKSGIGGGATAAGGLTVSNIGYAGSLANNNTVSWTGGGSDPDGNTKVVKIFSDGASSTYSLVAAGASGSSSVCTFTEYTGAGIAGAANGKWHIFMAPACKAMTGVAVTQVTFAGYRVWEYSVPTVTAFDTGINGAVGYLAGGTNFAASGTWGGATGTLSTATSLVLGTVAIANGGGLDSLSDNTGTDTPNPATPDIAVSSGGGAWYRAVSSTSSPTINGAWAHAIGAGIEYMIVVVH